MKSLARLQGAVHECSPQRVNKSKILPEIKRLVKRSGLPVLEIADRAKVDYQALRRFLVGTTATYNATSAECVYYVLTGQSFVRSSDTLVVKAKRKGRAA